MQRLRHIKQLATVELVFPGATHNRLEHSIGVYHVATVIFDALYNRRRVDETAQDWPELLPTYRLAVQLAALFHDVGHGPFSHIWDMFCRRNPDFAAFDHKSVTEKLIRDGKPDNDIHQFLVEHHNEMLSRNAPAASLLAPKNIAAIATGVPPRDNPELLFLSQIVAGAFDADRLDYLRRDSMHIGIGAGSVDVWSVIHNFILAKEQPAKGETVWVLKLEPDAAVAAENLLAVRDLAYRRVYYHPTNRAAVEMLVRALQDHVSMSDSPSAMGRRVLRMTDGDLINALSNGTQFSKDIAERIRKRNLYEPLPFEINVFHHLGPRAKQRLAEIVKPLTKKTFDEWVQMEASASELAGMPANERVIFDIEQTPISKKSAYTRKHFFGASLGEAPRACSLLELLPHLKMTHGDSDISGVGADNHLRYTEEISQVLVFIPYSHVDQAIAEILALLQDENPDSTNAPTKEEMNLAVERVYEARMQPLLDTFLQFIGADDDDTLSKRMHKQTTSYLREHVRQEETRLS